MTETMKITRASLEEMEFFLSLAAKEGWNPGIDDAKPFFETDPAGFFIAYIKEQKIGCISAVAYDKAFGFMGFYIVIPKYRGKGLGLKLWEKAVGHLGSLTIGLDGVVAQEENYRRSGFVVHHRNIRFEGTYKGTSSASLTDLKEIPIDALRDYDAPIFGLAREKFLRLWINMPNAYALGKWHRNKLRGYGVIHKCLEGYKIGPMFADAPEVAQELFDGLCAQAAGEKIFFDVPEINQVSLEMAEGAHFKKVFETLRMYNKPPPATHWEKIYGITTFELG